MTPTASDDDDDFLDELPTAVKLERLDRLIEEAIAEAVQVELELAPDGEPVERLDPAEFCAIGTR